MSKSPDKSGGKIRVWNARDEEYQESERGDWTKPWVGETPPAWNMQTEGEVMSDDMRAYLKSMHRALNHRSWVEAREAEMEKIEQQRRMLREIPVEEVDVEASKPLVVSFWTRPDLLPAAGVELFKSYVRDWYKQTGGKEYPFDKSMSPEMRDKYQKIVADVQAEVDAETSKRKVRTASVLAGIVGAVTRKRRQRGQ